MEDPNSTYRTLHLLVKHGDKLANGVAIAVFLLGPVIWLVNGSFWGIPRVFRRSCVPVADSAKLCGTGASDCRYAFAQVSDNNGLSML